LASLFFASLNSSSTRFVIKYTYLHFSLYIPWVRASTFPTLLTSFQQSKVSYEPYYLQIFSVNLGKLDKLLINRLLMDVRLEIIVSANNIHFQYIRFLLLKDHLQCMNNS
jgi:hypothetical protein